MVRSCCRPNQSPVRCFNCFVSPCPTYDSWDDVPKWSEMTRMQFDVKAKCAPEKVIAANASAAPWHSLLESGRNLLSAIQGREQKQ